MQVTPTSYAASIELLRQMAAQQIKTEHHQTQAQAVHQSTEQAFEQMVRPELSSAHKADAPASGINAQKLTQNAQAAQQAQAQATQSSASAQATAQITAPTSPTGSAAPTSATGAPQSASGAATPGTALPPGAAVPRAPNSGFNSLGNLSTSTNFKDYALLNSQQAGMVQAVALAQATGASAAAALQPALILQLGMLQKLYSWSRQLDQRKNVSSDSPDTVIVVSADEGDDISASLVISMLFLERAHKLIDSCKQVALSRYFKKGPLGEHLHQDDTDDEYGTAFADVDAETDYIKRPRHEKAEMNFHYAMLS